MMNDIKQKVCDILYIINMTRSMCEVSDFDKGSYRFRNVFIFIENMKEDIAIEVKHERY